MGSGCSEMVLSVFVEIGRLSAVRFLCGDYIYLDMNVCNRK